MRIKHQSWKSTLILLQFTALWKIFTRKNAGKSSPYRKPHIPDVPWQGLKWIPGTAAVCSLSTSHSKCNTHYSHWEICYTGNNSAKTGQTVYAPHEHICEKLTRGTEMSLVPTLCAYFNQESFYLLYKLPASQTSPSPAPLTSEDKAVYGEVYGEGRAASQNLQGAEWLSPGHSTPQSQCYVKQQPPWSKMAMTTPEMINVEVLN